MSEPATLTPAGERILVTASDLFYREGIHAVGVEGIATTAGVTKKTLYDCFGSKDELVAAYLRARDARWRAWMTGFVDRHGETAGDRALASFDALADWMRRENPRGCGFVNALAELPSPDHPGRAVILEQKRWMLDYLTGLVEAAQLPQPHDLARSLLLLHEGATVADATGSVTAAVEQAKKVAAALITRP